MLTCHFGRAYNIGLFDMFVHYVYIWVCTGRSLSCFSSLGYTLVISAENVGFVIYALVLPWKSVRMYSFMRVVYFGLGKPLSIMFSDIFVIVLGQFSAGEFSIWFCAISVLDVRLSLLHSCEAFLHVTTRLNVMILLSSTWGENSSARRAVVSPLTILQWTQSTRRISA